MLYYFLVLFLHLLNFYCIKFFIIIFDIISKFPYCPFSYKLKKITNSTSFMLCLAYKYIYCFLLYKYRLWMELDTNKEEEKVLFLIHLHFQYVYNYN